MERRLSPRDWLFIAMAASLGVLFVYMQVIRSGEPLALDQGLFACFGNWPELLPYRDIFDSKPPLFLYTWTLAWQLGGQSATGVWWFEAVWMAATMGLLFALVSRLWGRWAGLVAAAVLFIGMWTPGFGGWWSRAQAEEFLAVFVIAAGWVALVSVERPRLAFWVGVLTGVVGLYKIPAMCAGGVWLALWIARCDWRQVGVRIGWATLGVLAPWSLLLIWFAAHGAAGDFYEGVFVYQRHFAELVSPPWSWTARNLVRTLASELPAVLIAAVAGLVIAWRSDRPRAVWLTAWVILPLVAVMLQRQLAGYHFLLLVPGLAIAAGLGISGLARSLADDRAGVKVSAGLTLCVIAVVQLRGFGDWRQAYGPGHAYKLGGMERAAYLEPFEIGIISPAVEERVAAYLRQRTEPNDQILVWGLAPGIYALADRQPTSRYPFHKLLLTGAPLSQMIPGLEARRADFLRRLRATPPAYIVIGTKDRSPFEPSDSITNMMRFSAYAELVRKGYDKETQIGRFMVLGRKEASDAPAAPMPDWSLPVPEIPPGGVAEAGYVGSKRCQGCHKQIYRSYMRHSMARSGMRPIAQLDQRWLATIFDRGARSWVRHSRSGYSYRPFRRGKEYFVEEARFLPDGTKISSWVQKVTHTLSAGTYGLALYFRSGAELYHIPIDYFAKAGRWGLDPFAAGGGPRFFRQLGPYCISCHSDYPRHSRSDRKAFFDPMPTGIGCERCHGPGARHAETLDPKDIINPAKLPRGRQLDVCAQCHLQSYSVPRAGRHELSYRPGEALADQRMVYLGDPPERDRFELLSHTDRMVRSPCFTKSQGALTCTTCHDPHASSVGRPPAYWDRKCGSCHTSDEHPCTEKPASKRGKSCVSCHMRSGPPSGIPLVTVTDHWIQRRPPPMRSGKVARPTRLIPWPSVLGEAARGPDLRAVAALAHRKAGLDEQARRLAEQARGDRHNVRKLYGLLQEPGRQGAIAASRKMLAVAPSSRTTLLAYARQMLTEGQKGSAGAIEEAKRALERLLRLDPRDQTALELQGIFLFRSGKIDDARAVFERAITAGPAGGAARVGLAVLAMRQNQHRVASEHLEAARRIAPTDPWILDALVRTYRATRDARLAELTRIRASLGASARPSFLSAWLPRGWR